MDVLLAILSRQRPEGGFELNAPVAHKLGLELGMLREAAPRVELGMTETLPGLAGDPKHIFVILCTALVLRILEANFADEQATWRGVVHKSRQWLNDILAMATPEVDGQDIMSWAAKHVPGRVIT